MPVLMRYLESYGILLDNAIEASSLSNEKKIIFEVLPVPTFDNSNSVVNITIENSYSNKDVNLDKISEKGFTSKSKDTRVSWIRFMESVKYFEKI